MTWPIEEILEIVREMPTAVAGWPRLRHLCSDSQPSGIWDELNPDPVEDVAAARAWLQKQLTRRAAPSPPRGVYLGLDTLNMEGRGGYNIEIGVNDACDPAANDISFCWECCWYGKHHLIQGLKAMKSRYEAPEYKAVYDFADYVLFLGYSGLVLAQALQSVRVPYPVVFAWGFHDGDVYVLGRLGGEMFDRVAERGTGGG